MRRSRQYLANRARSAGFSMALVGDNFEPEAPSELQHKMVGSVILSTTDGYDAMRLEVIDTYQSWPQIICYCEVPRDVQLSLEFAIEHHLNPVCRSGGHSTAGYSVNDQMVIDVSRMSYVVVDEHARTAKVGSGTNFEKLNAVLTPFGLHVPGGGCPGVGVAGYMQGGGFGYTAQIFGMNCDNVVECTVALADSTIVTANEKENSDLFWALRGGTGNNFGVLLDITYRLYEVDDFWGFGLHWPLATPTDVAAAAEALTVWQTNYTGDAPVPNTGIQLFVAEIQREGKPTGPELLIRGMHRGDETECEAARKPLFDLFPDLASGRDIWRSGTYEDLNDYLMSYPTELPNVPQNVRAVVESRIIADPLETTDWQAYLEYFLNADKSDLMLVIEPYGGAINRPKPTDTAFVHRRALMDLFVWSFWMHEAEQTHAQNYIEQFRTLMDPLWNHHAYQNYPNRDTAEDAYPEMYWGENYPRLQTIKAKYDPNSLFRFPQMVQPAPVDGP